MAGRWIRNPAAVEWAFEQTVGDAGAKFTLVILARHVNMEWSCTLGQALLAEATDQSLATVSRALKRLEKCGRPDCKPAKDETCDHPKFIKRTPRYDDKGHRTSDLCRLNPSLALPVNLTTRQIDVQGLPVNLTGGSEQGELPTSQNAYQANCGRKSFSTRKTEDKNTNKGGVGGSKGKPKPADEHPSFAEWYGIYPLHKAPGAARKAFNAAVKKVDNVQILIDAAKKYRDEPSVRRGFAAYPATWLNQERWLDEASLADTGTEGYSFENITETAGGYE